MPENSSNSFLTGLLDHYNVSTDRLDETVRFYVHVLGFKNGDRPPFSFPGAWLYSAGQPVLHLNDISESGGQKKSGTGVIDHIAFRSEGFGAMVAHLDSLGIAYRLSEAPDRPRRQIFVVDPNGVEIELNFPNTEQD